MCERCHTQRDEHGNPDRAHWLQGGPVQTEPTYAAPTWATREPRIAGSPAGTDAEFITLMTTGISVAQFIGQFDRKTRLGDLIQWLAEKTNTAFDRVAGESIPITRRLLEEGYLEV